MTKKEVIAEMACSSVKEGEDYNGEKVLVPIYNRLSFVGTPMYAFGDGSEDGWEVGDSDKCFKCFDRINGKAIAKNKLAEKLKKA